MLLKNIKITNMNRLVIGHLNINSVKNKFDTLKSLVMGNLDILILIESKLDESFPRNQFFINGYSPPYRLDRKSNGGGVLIYAINDIPCSALKTL